MFRWAYTSIHYSIILTSFSSQLHISWGRQVFIFKIACTSEFKVPQEQIDLNLPYDIQKTPIIFIVHDTWEGDFTAINN